MSQKQRKISKRKRLIGYLNLEKDTRKKTKQFRKIEGENDPCIIMRNNSK